MFYWLTTTLGSESEPYFDALVLWKFAIYILAAVCLYFTARIYGVNRALAVIFVCFALFIGRSFFDIRPAGFSNLLVAVFMLVLALASYRNALYIWLIVPLIVFWSNVHGGYIYAFIMLVPFIVWHAIMNLPRRWTIAAYSILLWLVLYGLANRFLGHEHLHRSRRRLEGCGVLPGAACHRGQHRAGDQRKIRRRRDCRLSRGRVVRPVPDVC